MRKSGWVVIAVAACGDDGGATKTDAAVDGQAAAIDAPMFNCATSPSNGTHKIFLSFEGITLTAGPTDATQNITGLFQENLQSATLAAWKSAAPDRAAQIDLIVCSVREAFFTFDVEITTTRPASGDYDMIVFGGQPSDLGFTGTSMVMEWITSGDCMNTIRNDLGVVFERPSNNNPGTTSARDSAIGAAVLTGAGEVLSLSKDPKNCMCNLNGNEFVNCDRTKMCGFSATSPINVGNCTTSGGTEDQFAKLIGVYGARQP